MDADDMPAAEAGGKGEVADKEGEREKGDNKEANIWWLTRWLKSDAFWQGIAIQTLGTLLGASIIALVAIFVGVGSYTPAIRYYVIYGVFILAFILISAGSLIIAVRRAWRALKIRDEQRFERSFLAIWNLTRDLGSAIVAIFLGYIILLGIGTLIAKWTHYTPK